MMSNRVYDILKYAAIIGIPAVAAFYRALAGIWGLPGTEEVPATLNALETLLGALLWSITNRNRGRIKHESARTAI